jgi:hypothetical protein
MLVAESVLVAANLPSSSWDEDGPDQTYYSHSENVQQSMLLRGLFLVEIRAVAAQNAH